MFVQRNCAEQLKSNLKWNHNRLIHICMKWRDRLISVADTKYAIYIHYTLIILVLILFFKSNWRGGWVKGFLVWNVSKNKRWPWCLPPSATISLYKDLSALSWVQSWDRVSSHKAVMIQPDLADEWLVNLMRSADLLFVLELLSSEQTFGHFQAWPTNLYEFVFSFLSRLPMK